MLCGCASVTRTVPAGAALCRGAYIAHNSTWLQSLTSDGLPRSPCVAACIVVAAQVEIPEHGAVQIHLRRRQYCAAAVDSTRVSCKMPLRTRKLQ